jgi:electron transport complex protein RnfD
MNTGTLVSGPYAHSRRSTARIMGLVMLALLPATGYGIYLFGGPALFLLLVTLASTVTAEALCLRLAGKPVRLFVLDGSALLSGWLLALTLPPWAPWWIGVLGGAIAIVIGKQVFGGIGQNPFNPAMVARVVLLISFPLEMTTFLAPTPCWRPGRPACSTASASPSVPACRRTASAARRYSGASRPRSAPDRHCRPSTRACRTGTPWRSARSRAASGRPRRC